jgi:hypothetical protein
MACVSTAILIKEAVMLSTERSSGGMDIDLPAPTPRALRLMPRVPNQRLAPLTLHATLRRTSRLSLGLALHIADV